jgi:hypothetical protein
MKKPFLMLQLRAPGEILILLGLVSGIGLAQAAQPLSSSVTEVNYVDQKARAKGESNLNPPPPGRTRLDGLYATQDTNGHIGPGGVFYQDFKWRFYHFMPNGYVYLGAKEAGQEELSCTRATVNKYGDPLCTTYSADDGILRMGLRTTSRLVRKGNDLRIGDYDYALIPKVSNLRLNGNYEFYSAGSAAAISGGIAFSPDGRFKSSSFVGVAVDTDPTNSNQTGGNRVTVTGSNASKAEGTYRINGYTLEMDYSDGRKARAFFAQVASDKVVRIGSRVYTRK